MGQLTRDNYTLIFNQDDCIILDGDSFHSATKRGPDNSYRLRKLTRSNTGGSTSSGSTPSPRGASHARQQGPKYRSNYAGDGPTATFAQEVEEFPNLSLRQITDTSGDKDDKIYPHAPYDTSCVASDERTKEKKGIVAANEGFKGHFGLGSQSSFEEPVIQQLRDEPLLPNPKRQKAAISVKQGKAVERPSGEDAVATDHDPPARDKTAVKSAQSAQTGSESIPQVKGYTTPTKHSVGEIEQDPAESGLRDELVVPTPLLDHSTAKGKSSSLLDSPLLPDRLLKI